MGMADVQTLGLDRQQERLIHTTVILTSELVRASEKVELYWHIRTACKYIYKQIYKRFLTKPNNIK